MAFSLCWTRVFFFDAGAPLNAGKICDFQEAKSVFDHGFETSLYRFNISLGPGKLLMFGVGELAQDRPQIVKFLGLK